VGPLEIGFNRHFTISTNGLGVAFEGGRGALRQPSRSRARRKISWNALRDLARRTPRDMVRP
jgi:hypothetical protein